MSDVKRTQRARIVMWFETHDTLNSQEASFHLGIARLTARISELRDFGFIIESNRVNTLNKWGEKTHYVDYKIVALPGDYEQYKYVEVNA